MLLLTICGNASLAEGEKRVLLNHASCYDCTPG
jgi:hypothetical protein